MPLTLRVWRFTDGRVGHEKQTSGLVQGLRESLPEMAGAGSSIECRDIPVAEFLRNPSVLWQDSGAAPDLLIGAGRRTHLLMARVRWHLGSRTVCLMRSTLPRFCYDLALVPEHDWLWSERKVLRTLGALGPSIPSAPSAECGLILLGGENDHFYWSDEEVCASVSAIVAQNPRVHWQISDSPRSSKNLISAVDRALHGADNAETVHYLDNDPQWLTQTLARAGQVWVSSDSASMLYEALSSAARVGVIELTSKRANNKLAAGIDALRREQRVGTLSAGPLDAQALKVEPLREQVRCARWILQQWFSPED